MASRAALVGLVVFRCASHPSPTPGGPTDSISPAPQWTAVDDDARALEVIAGAAGFAGVILVGSDEQLRLYRPFGAASPSVPEQRYAPDARWRWASVTKQLVAVLIMQEVARGTIDLGAPISRYLPRFPSPNAGTLSVEQLLRHQSGLPNPEGDAGTGVPALYNPAIEVDPVAFCAGPVTGPPGGAWTYNNCDYTIAGEILRAVTKKPWDVLVAERFALPLGLGLGASPTMASDVEGWIGTTREPAYAYERFAGAGAAVGTLVDLWRFDRALMTGKLLPEPVRATLWDGKPELGFMALGQWVYDAPLAGCSKPARLVERRGAIGGIEIRNFIAPQQAIVVIAATNRGDFEFGELWSGSGFAFELLSRAVCSKSPR